MFAMMYELVDIMKSNKPIEEPWSFWLLVVLELVIEIGLTLSIYAIWESLPL